MEEYYCLKQEKRIKITRLIKHGLCFFWYVFVKLEIIKKEAYTGKQ